MEKTSSTRERRASCDSPIDLSGLATVIRVVSGSDDHVSIRVVFFWGGYMMFLSGTGNSESPACMMDIPS